MLFKQCKNADAFVTIKLISRALTLGILDLQQLVSVEAGAAAAAAAAANGEAHAEQRALPAVLANRCV